MPQIDASQRAVWEERWNALGNVLTSMAGWGVDGVVSFSTLVQCLQEFGRRQFYYFLDGLTEGAGYSFEPDPEYPPEYVLTVILDQVEYDLAVLRRVAEQRMRGTLDMTTTLNRADEMAWRALQPVAQGNTVGGQVTTVITYFHKSPDIRVIPYASAALIGIPFTCTGRPRDFLAVPHEVGHFVFWRGTDNSSGQLFREMLPSAVWSGPGTSLPYWFHWIEEVFADVYGCLVAGPVKALDFQNLQLQLSQKRFIEDDGEHPVPLLRPVVYPKVLKAITSPTGIDMSLIGDLVTKWENDSSNRLAALVGTMVAATYPLEAADGEQMFTMNTAISPGTGLGPNPVDTVIDEILNAPLNLASMHPVWWLDYYRSDYTIGQLYGKFESQAAALTADSKTVLPLSVDAPQDVWDTWLASQPYVPPASSEIPKETWRRVLRADGWVTKGPNTVWRR